MIPKIIHYCWFGKKKKPVDVVNYIESWKKNLPDYKIIEWNEENFDVNRLSFTKEAYALRKFAFVADYVRLYALDAMGGIYLDTDVEVLRNMDSLLECTTFIGFEVGGIQLGTAVIGSMAKSQWLADLMKIYEEYSFIRWNGKLNITPNPRLFNSYFISYGLELNDCFQVLRNKCVVYPTEFFCGMDYYTRNVKTTNNTFCIHHYAGSWCKRKDNRIKRFFSLFYNIGVKIKYL